MATLADLYGMDPGTLAALGLGQQETPDTSPSSDQQLPSLLYKNTTILPATIGDVLKTFRQNVSGINQQIGNEPFVNIPEFYTAIVGGKPATGYAKDIPGNYATPKEIFRYDLQTGVGPNGEVSIPLPLDFGAANQAIYGAPHEEIQVEQPAGAGEVPYGQGPLGVYPTDQLPISAVVTATTPAPTAEEFIQFPSAALATAPEEVVPPRPPAPEEVAAVQVKQALAVQALAPEQPNWWDNLQLVTKAAAQPPLVTPEAYEQQVAIEQAQKDRADYLDQELAQQMKTPDEQVLQWLGTQGTGVENWEALSGFAGTTGIVNQTPTPEPATPAEKKQKMVSTGITKMIDSLADDDELGQLATRLNGVLTGGSLFASPDDDGRIKAIMAKVRVDPDIMTAVISNVSKRMYSRPGLIPLGSLGRLPSLI